MKLQHDADFGLWGHYCPGCKSIHEIAVEKPFPNGARWSFNGSLDSPTFTPSINIGWATSEGAPKRCHYHLTAGQIKYLGDCTHELRGQTVPLPDIPETMR